MRTAMKEVNLSVLCKYIVNFKRLLRHLPQYAGICLKNNFGAVFMERCKEM